MADDRLYCLCCSEEVEGCEPHMICSECNFIYHVGKCSGTSETQFSSMRETTKKSWRCQTCRVGRSRSGSKDKSKSQNPESSKEVQTETDSTQVTHETKTGAVPSDIAAILLDIQMKLNSLLELKTTVEKIELSVQVMSDKYDTILADTTRHEADIKGIKKKVQALETKVYSEVDPLKEQLNDLEWRNRKLNLEFHGIKPTENENLIEKVNEVATLLNVAPLSCNDVAAIHRLPAKPGKTPGIIVRFSRNDTRDEWFAKRRKLRTAESPVFIQENLTKHCRLLLFEAKKWAKEQGFQFAWHRNGKILVRRKDGDRERLIRSVGDLALAAAEDH